MRRFVISNTAATPAPGNNSGQQRERVAMDAGKTARTAIEARKNAEKDIATLIELLKMEAELPPLGHQASQIDLLRQDQSLLALWPEACRRTGAGEREFPAGVIKLWKESLGGTN